MQRTDPKAWMLTYTGKAYWPTDPYVDDVCIEDIAHGLSMLCRYNGAVRHFYSVAEHSYHVSYMVPPELALEGLLHDATEAYCGDMIRPLKHAIPDYQRIEDRNAVVIRSKFHLPHEESALVKAADTNILFNELSELMPMPPIEYGWHGTTDPNVSLKLWCPTIAEEKFLARYRQLIEARDATR
jgi:hypothetical protein